MTDKRSILLFSSTVVLTLALRQSALAEPIEIEPPQPIAPSTAPAAAKEANPGTPAPSENTASSAQASPHEASAPVVPAPSTDAPPVGAAATEPPAPPIAEPAVETSQPPPPRAQMDAARERMEQRRAEMLEKRNRRYEELRERAAEVGLELPETPPWEQAGMRPGASPAERDAMRAQRHQAMRERAMQRGIELPETPPWTLMSDEERKAHWEKMRTMSPEERLAMREKHWEEMRDRARERGVEMPETPPWKQAEQRREEMKARWESYEKTLDAMTAEQKEAIQALFGPRTRRASPPAIGRQMPPGIPMQAPLGQQRSYGFPSCFGMPGHGAQGTGPSMFDMGGPAPWYGAEQPMRPGPVSRWPGGNEGWLNGPPPPGAD